MVEWNKIFVWFNQIVSHPENSFLESKKHLFDERSKKTFLWIEESFAHAKTLFFNVNKSISLDQRQFFWVSKTFFNSKKFLFFNRIAKKSFIDSQKLFSQCEAKHLWLNQPNSFCIFAKMQNQKFHFSNKIWEIREKR